MSGAVQRRKGEAKRGGDDVAEPTPVLQTVTIKPSTGHLGVSLSDFDFGVLVDDVHPADIIAKAGIRKGSVIVSVGGTAVNTHAEALQLMDGVESEVHIEFYSAKDAALEKAERDAKYAAKWAWFGWKIKTVLVVALLLLLGGGGYALNSFAKSLAETNGAKASSMPPPPPPPLPPLDGFTRELKKSELERAVDKLEASNPAAKMMTGVLRERYLTGDKAGSEDPRQGLEMLKMLSGEMESMQAMREMAEAAQAAQKGGV